MEILILLIILLLVFGGSGFYTTRSGYEPVGGLLYVLCVGVAIIVVLRLLSVF
jgi:hypothetical protein